MSLHAISVFDKVYKINEALRKIASQKHHQVLQRSENRQITGFILLISPHRLLR